MKSLWGARITGGLSEERVGRVLTELVKLRTWKLFADIESQDLRVEEVDIREEDGVLRTTVCSEPKFKKFGKVVLRRCQHCGEYVDGAEGHSEECRWKTVYEVMET